jgi:methionyl-tRNA synthetase
LAPDFDGLTARVEELIGRAELTLALEEIWQRVRRLNRYVEEQAPWQLAKDDARAGDLDRVLGTLAEGLRVVTVLLWPYLPESSERLLAALGAPDLSLAGATLGAGRIERVSQIESLFPKSA